MEQQVPLGAQKHAFAREVELGTAERSGTAEKTSTVVALEQVAAHVVSRAVPERSTAVAAAHTEGLGTEEPGTAADSGTAAPVKVVVGIAVGTAEPAAAEGSACAEAAAVADSSGSSVSAGHTGQA